MFSDLLCRLRALARMSPWLLASALIAVFAP